MADDIEIQGRITIDDQGTIKLESFNKALGKVESTSKSASGHLGIFGNAAQHLGNVLDYAFGQVLVQGLEKAGSMVLDFGKSIIDAGMKSEDVSAQLDAVFKSTQRAFGDKQVFESYGDQLKTAQAQLVVMEKQFNKTGAASGFTAQQIEAQKQNIDALKGSVDKFGSTAGVYTKVAGQVQITKQAVLDLADSLSKTTKFEDENIVSGESLLLTFTNIGGKVFPDATKTMLDMSQALGQDLKSSAIQLGKALQDPITGITALKRVGVNFSEEQKKMIAGLVSAGKTEEAQKVILQELQTEFGGSAEAAGKTFAGQLQIAQNRIENMKEKIGGALLPVLGTLLSTFEDKFTPVLEAAADGFSNAMAVFSKTGDARQAADTLALALSGILPPGIVEGIRQVGNTINTMVADFQEGAGPTNDFANGVINMISGLITGPGQFQSLGIAVTGFLSTINSSLPMIQGFANDMVTFLQGAVTQLAAILGPQLAQIINGATTFWKAHGTEVMAIIDFAFKFIVTVISGTIQLITTIIQVGLTFIEGIFSAVSMAIKGNWTGAWQALTDTNKQLLNELQTFITNFLNTVLSLVGTNLAQFNQVWSDNFNMAKDLVTTVFNNIKAFMLGQIKEWIQIGKNLVQGLWDGINANFGQFMHDLQFKLQQVKDLVAGIFQVHSPSKFTEGIGKNLVEGLSKGTADRFRIESPSKVFEKFGTMINQGFANGLTNSAQLPLAAMASLSDSLMLSGQTTTASQISTDNSRSINFYMNGDPSQRPGWFDDGDMNRLSNLARSV